MKYCEFCGKPIESSEGCFCPEAQAKKNTIQSKHKSGKTLIFGISAVALLTLVLIAVFSIPFGKSDSSGGSSLGADASGTGSSGSLFDKSSKIDPFDYTEIKFTGYDTLGEVDIDFSITDIDDIIIGPEPEDMAAFTVWLARYESFKGSVDFECSKVNGLSNGDKVTITFTVTDDYKKYVKATSKEITVSGLTETTKYDFFADIEVCYEGHSGDIKAEVKKLINTDLMNACSFSCSPRLALSNGDVVTVTIENPETIAKKYSVVPMETSKEYVVSNLPEYISSADQIPEGIVKDLINEFIETTEEENVASAKEMLGIGVTWTYSKPMFHSAYFMKRTSYHSWAKNELAIVVSYIKNQGSSDEETVFTVLEFWNVAVNSDDTMNIAFEDGSNSISTTNWEATLNDYKDDYEVYKINIK